jgi:hypothetical protein
MPFVLKRVVGPTMVDIVDIDKLLLGIYAFNR